MRKCVPGWGLGGVGIDQPVLEMASCVLFSFGLTRTYSLSLQWNGKVKTGFSCGAEVGKGGLQISFGSRLFILVWLEYQPSSQGPAAFTSVENRSSTGDKGCILWEDFLI